MFNFADHSRKGYIPFWHPFPFPLGGFEALHRSRELDCSALLLMSPSENRIPFATAALTGSSSYFYIFFQWENGRGSIPCSIRPVLWRGSCPAQMAGNHRLIVHLQQVQHLVPPLPLLQRNLQRGTVHREQTWKTMENKYCLVKNGISGSWIVIISNRKGSNSMTYDRKKTSTKSTNKGLNTAP